MPKRGRDKRASENAGGRGHPVTVYFVLFVVSLLGAGLVLGERGVLARLQADRQHEEAVAALERARAENALLREEIRRLREDPSAIEEIARRELGLIKPGEKLFIIKERPAADVPKRPAR
jgi:cell division protein FtsB